MAGLTNGRRWRDIDEVVEAYEAAHARDGRADLLKFVPAPDHPEYLAIICELIRVDLEYGWRYRRAKPLAYYQALFPDLFEDSRLAREVAFEESRLRRQAGEDDALERNRRVAFPGAEEAMPSSTATPSREGSLGVSEAAAAYQAYRRGLSDDPVELDAVFASRSVPCEQAELFRNLYRDSPRTADRLARAAASLPDPDTEFLGFRLEAELGRGAFGRVYLARQAGLADRRVALKISADVAGETHALAQLQHTNIVPIYSVHRRGALQAVCMPYLGATTLADVVGMLKQHETLPDSGAGLLSSRRSVGDPPATRPADEPEGSRAIAQAERPAPVASVQVERIRGLGYVSAVLWLISRVADGLAHAHEHGILHRDLKPANILFSDDGEPLLLDFNLADDTKLRIHASAALVGGTLPYMAPEHLEAFDRGTSGAGSRIDARSDLYALGLLLFELLTGRHPFELPRGSLDEVLPRMIQERRGPAPDPRRWNNKISPAAASIVLHCLEPDPARRYQSARELQADLQNHLADLPLAYARELSWRERAAKWARRHPRLSSSTTVVLGATCLIATLVGGFLVRQHRMERLEATDAYYRVAQQLPGVQALAGMPGAESQLGEGLALCRAVVDEYRVLDDPHWRAGRLVRDLLPAQRRELFPQLGQILLLAARGEVWHAAPRRPERLAYAARLIDVAATCFGSDTPAALWSARADVAELAGSEAEARELRSRAEATPPKSPFDRFWFVSDRLHRGEKKNVLPTVQETLKKEPRNYLNWMLLGNYNAHFGQPVEAAFCYGTALALRPDLYWANYNRGLLHLDIKKYDEAKGDFDRVIELRPALAEAYVNRALARAGLEDFAGAVDDLTHALALPDAPTRALFIRAGMRRRLGDRHGAERDREEGLRKRPSDEASWIARGLARLPGDPDGALADYDAALALNPNSLPALQNKASLLAERLSRTEEALALLDRAVAAGPSYVKARAGRGVLLARLGRREAALRDAEEALAIDKQALNLYQVACIYALTSGQEPSDCGRAIRLLADTFRKDPTWLTVARRDRDLDPIRGRPEFRELLAAITVVLRGDGPQSPTPPVGVK